MSPADFRGVVMARVVAVAPLALAGLLLSQRGRRRTHNDRRK
jgi:hypothetical protein